VISPVSKNKFLIDMWAISVTEAMSF